MIAYVLDEALRQETNQAGRNYWDAYLEEICTQLGVGGTPLSPLQVENGKALAQVRTLMVGAQSGARLSARARERIGEWVRRGGTLIGFAVSGMDEAFGIRTQQVLPQPNDYAIAAYFEFRLHPLTREIHPFLYIEQQLLVLSDVRLAHLEDGVELAHLYDAEGQDLGRPAITWRSCGDGWAGYFAFDVPKTIWLLHQGRPLPPISDGQLALRTPQLQVLGRNSARIAYADEIVHLLQNMMARGLQPFIYPIPPDGGEIPEALLYYSGDEYTGPVELSLQASDFMASQGLPYHINIAAERHPMTRAEWQHIVDNGHEVSCYMWIRTDEGGSLLTQERLQVQSDRLLERFGFRPGSVLIGSTQWRGWAEPARWLAAAGVRADNTFVGSKLFDHPLLNGPFFGFGFGTGYPFFFYEDHERGNVRIDLIEQPIVGYELGHRGSLVDEHTRERELETRSTEDVHEPIDRAVRYHLVLNLFYHPYYIANCAYCRDAIQEIRRYIEYRGARVLHLGANQVAEWWRARARSTVEDFQADSRRARFASHCAWPGGMIVKLRLEGQEVAGVKSAAHQLPFAVKREFGEDWLYAVVPSGQQRVEVSFAAPHSSRA